MVSAAPNLGRGRELAVLAAGVAAAAALAWAGVTVHEGLGTAGELAVARLTATAADTVVAEWERGLRAAEPPLAPAGEVFQWTVGDALAPADSEAPSEAQGPSVARTLLAEAERCELVEGDPAGALELVLEALQKRPEPDTLPALHLFAVQLGARLGWTEVVRASWEALRAPELGLGTGADVAPIPARVLAWLSLPEELRIAEPSATLLTTAELERLLMREDRLTLGPTEAPEARFELAPLLLVLLERLGLEPPPRERRAFAALTRLAAPPGAELVEGRWLPHELAGRPFLVRREGARLTGFFHSSRALEQALHARSGLPAGFALDLAGDDEALGVAVRPRTELPGSPYAFTLRHADPGRIARAESARQRLLRGALVGLALLCAAGGWLTARVLARERELGRLRSAFVAGVSHDLRTPLASILLLAENLESGAADVRGRARYHAALRKEATRLRRLIDDVLDFSRLERGKPVELQREPVELERYLAELEDDWRARVEAAGRALTAERGVLPELAWLDPHALRRALDNLLDNALEHGRGAIRLAGVAERGRLRFTLSDEGPGVPAAERERVFEPFERLGGTNGHTGGTGLGLAIVRAIARAHGGEARVRPGAGAATVFELDLPLATEDEGA